MQTAFLLLLLAWPVVTDAIKLRIQKQECINHHFDMYQPFYGSFVSLPDVYHHTAIFDLDISAPSGTKVHELHSTTEGRFHLVPYETGLYKFCLTMSPYQYSKYYTSEKEVVWELFVGHADHSSDHAKEADTQTLWHYVTMVDAQLQQLRSTLSYLYWRERRHRMTVESTNSRVMWYALLRASSLVLVSVLQVLGVRYLFRERVK